MTETSIEKRKRRIVGWVFLIAFLSWKLLMIAQTSWLVTYSQDVSAIGVGSSSEEAVRNIGATIVVGMILFAWVLSSVIASLLALLTRGSKTMVREV